MEDYALPEGCALGLKVTLPGGVPESPYAPKGFRWSLTLGGETEAPDWDPTPKVGGGLHVWAWAQGDLSCSKVWRGLDVIWLAVEYQRRDSVQLRGAVKVPWCKTILADYDPKVVSDFIRAHTPVNHTGLSFFELVQSNTERSLCVGAAGTAIGGKDCVVVAGWHGSAVTGDRGVAVAEDFGTVRAGKEGTARVGDYGNAKVRSGGTAIAGYAGIAIVVGEGGVATAGDGGFARVNAGGTAEVGLEGMAQAGEGGTMRIPWVDPEGHRQVVVLRVGENGILANTPYKVDRDGLPCVVLSDKYC